MEEKPPSERRGRSTRPAFSAPPQPKPEEEPSAPAPRRAAKAAPTVTFQAPSAENHPTEGPGAADTPGRSSQKPISGTPAPTADESPQKPAPRKPRPTLETRNSRPAPTRRAPDAPHPDARPKAETSRPAIPSQTTASSAPSVSGPEPTT